MKKRIAGWAAVCLAVGAMASPASAGVDSDAATQCMVKSATDADQITMVQWIFVGMATHPSLQAYANVSPEQRAAANKEMSAVVVRLLSQSCHKEVVDAMKNEGRSVLGKSFEALGQAAVGGLMTNPAVAKALTTWITPEAVQAFAALALESGTLTAPEK